jgi:hypothetical protein
MRFPDVDEVSFRLFLQEQHAALADIDVALRPWQNQERDAHPFTQDRNLQTRFDSVVRRLADAYMTGTDEQREAIRHLLRNLTAARRAMGISFTEIRHKMDAVRFRLALIYESMKDLGHDPRVGSTALNDLCRAARLVEINPDPDLKEVAAASSDIDRHGLGSVREMMLAQRTGGGARVRCQRCKSEYSAHAAECPHCHPSSWSPESGAAKDKDLPFTPIEHDEFVVESPIYLPMHKLLGVYFLDYAALALVVLVVVQVVRSFVTEGYHQTATAWIIYGIMAALYATLHYIRYDKLVMKYMTADGRSRIAETRLQQFLVLLLRSIFVLAICVAALMWFFWPE